MFGKRSGSESDSRVTTRPAASAPEPVSAPPPVVSRPAAAPNIPSPPIAAIPFDPQMFGSAANNGQMIAEISAGHRTTEMFLQIAQRLTGRGETKKPRGSFLSPLIEKLRAR